MNATAPAGGGVPPFVLIAGPESLLAERALAATLGALREADPDVEVIRIEAAGYQPGDLPAQVCPSLFGEAKAVVLADVDEGGEALHTDLLACLADPQPDVTVVVLHKSGQRGRKVVDALKKRRARVLDAAAVKTDKDKSDFVVNEFRTAGRKVTPEAVRALVEAVGGDLMELASACAQLVADTEGVVDRDVVDRYHGGKVEASGFRVADAAIAGNTPDALRLLRHAISSGVDPVPIVAVLAGQLRQLVRVAGAGRGPSGQVASALGMAPWQVDRSRRALAGWDLDALGLAIQAVAAADFQVKGGGRDPVFAVERAVLDVTQARNSS